MHAMRLPMMMVMNIAVTVTLARVTMIQTVILKTASPAQAQIAKTMKLNQLVVTGVKLTCQDKKAEQMNKCFLSSMLFFVQICIKSFK